MLFLNIFTLVGIHYLTTHEFLSANVYLISLDKSEKITLLGVIFEHFFAIFAKSVLNLIIQEHSVK